MMLQENKHHGQYLTSVILKKPPSTLAKILLMISKMLLLSRYCRHSIPRHLQVANKSAITRLSSHGIRPGYLSIYLDARCCWDKASPPISPCTELSPPSLLPPDEDLSAMLSRLSLLSALDDCSERYDRWLLSHDTRARS